MQRSVVKPLFCWTGALLALALATTPASARKAAQPAPPPDLVLTQDVMEAQPELLAQRLSELHPQRPGVIDVYAITFAPYSDEDVFRKESKMVADVMTQRFDTQGRSIQLVNNVATVKQWPWATRKNLQRTLARVAKLMDRDEDVLFIHLTSHGAYDGELVAGFWPMTVEPVTPALLKAWLDEAGIRNRVISVSACYSGTWIKPLADEHTLIMTASDATHTAYGCGKESELTFFGRAVFDEQLRKQTLSFEDAHAAARKLIKERETKARKKDGYSNPQIKVGTLIKDPLARLQTELAQRVKP